ncbi:MAG: phosphoribosylamine--glycine ligase [Prolixibacteraceae bacterium]|nr:phosphoribosylamine--glycine ligase [Prolixibacteraceae bacterium]
MNVLIIGSGGREHAIGWKISQSPKLNHLFFAPGNPGTAKIGVNLPVDIADFKALKKEALENEIDLMIVGPEIPLVQGIHDFFDNDIDLQHVQVIGPKKAGAMLEGSKDFAKHFMQKYNIPTARFASFTAATMHDGVVFLESLNAPYVIKADGLAAGKGVLILNSLEQAKEALTEMLHGKFGDAGNTVVIEEFLSGIELSVFVVTDGKNYILLPEAKDYKRIGEGDTGPNTGGMGAVSPVPFADETFMAKIKSEIIEPTISGLHSENIDYVGFIFFGLINCNGNPFVIEYNARMGDPETEAVMLRINSDFLDLLNAAAEGKLAGKTIETAPQPAATVMLVSGGYPGNFEKNKPITGCENISDSILFHAGTKLESGKLKTNGGRILAISSRGDTIAEAVEKSIKNAQTIEFGGKYFRSDIGFDLMQ